MPKLSFAIALLALLSVADAAPYRCRQDDGALRVGACPAFEPLQAWSEVGRALGIYHAEQFGSPGECATRAQQLANSWRLLGMVELPGIGNAAEYVDRLISTTAYDQGLGGEVRANYVHGRRVLLLGPAFFDPGEFSDAERAASLLHEARHAAASEYHHVLCGAASAMAWRTQCDRRFSAELSSARAGPWSYELVFLSLLREAQPCVGRAYLNRRIEALLGGVFGIVGEEQRGALDAIVKAARKAKRQ